MTLPPAVRRYAAHPFWQAVAIMVGAYVVVVWIIPILPGSAIVPKSVVLQYMVTVLVGVLIYVIARGDKMKAHTISDQRQQEIASTAEFEDLKDRGILTDEEFQRVKRQRKLSQQAPPSPDDDIAELENLRDRGLLTDEEFQRAKEKALA